MYGSATASSANLPRDVRCRARISSFRERRDLALAYLRYAVRHRRDTDSTGRPSFVGDTRTSRCPCRKRA